MNIDRSENASQRQGLAYRRSFLTSQAYLLRAREYLALGVRSGFDGAFYREAASVVLGDIDSTKLGGTVSELKAHGHEVLRLHFDVCNRRGWLLEIPLL
jgi:hypothetical protein